MDFTGRTNFSSIPLRWYEYIVHFKFDSQMAKTELSATVNHPYFPFHQVLATSIHRPLCDHIFSILSKAIVVPSPSRKQQTEFRAWCIYGHSHVWRSKAVWASGFNSPTLCLEVYDALLSQSSAIAKLNGMGIVIRNKLDSQINQTVFHVFSPCKFFLA